MKAEWKGKSSDEEGSMKGGVDKATGVRRPTYKRLFNPTMLGTNHVYQSISMMMVNGWMDEWMENGQTD